MKYLVAAIALLSSTAIAQPALAREASRPAPVNPQIDYAGFMQLVGDVRPYRDTRLLSFADFKRDAAKSGALLLDARSADAFAKGHITGAVNLPLTDFTAEALAKVIGPDTTRPIFIYCNNNFTNNASPVPVKALQLALNVQTFVNLVGYGYREVWELGEAVDFNTPDVAWVKS